MLGVRLGGVERAVFADGEIYVRPTESVRGADCFVLQSHSHPINHHIMEQLITIDALKRASAEDHRRRPLLRLLQTGQEGRPASP